MLTLCGLSLKQALQIEDPGPLILQCAHGRGNTRHGIQEIYTISGRSILLPLPEAAYDARSLMLSALFAPFRKHDGSPPINQA